MTSYIHDTITPHTHYTTYSLHHIQQISVTILQIHRTHIETYNHCTIYSATPLIIDMMYQLYHIRMPHARDTTHSYHT